MSNGQPRLFPAGTLMKDKVKNLAGESLGEIEDFVIDMESGRVAYCVLNFGGKFGGKLGLGNKLFAIPWQALTLDLEKHEFLLDVKKETLQNAPGFDKDRWPDMADPRWGTVIHTHYGVTPYWQKSL